MDKIDYKKKYKDLYKPPLKPVLVTVPAITYVTVDGRGDPNTSQEYKDAIELLYGLSYTIKMSKMSGNQPAGYFEYVVPPLEGLWWIDGEYFDGVNILDKSQFQWKSMIRLPEFVNQKVFQDAKMKLKEKKPYLHIEKLNYEVIEEGLCVQIMHKGSFDLEAESIMKMNQFVEDNHLVNDISKKRMHHEIYLSDFRKTKSENLKTVIRHPVQYK